MPDRSGAGVRVGGSLSGGNPAATVGAPGRVAHDARLILLPREHGSWGMLLLPFLSAMLLTRSVSVAFVPAILAALALFLAREPILVLARQRFVWLQSRPETELARRTLLIALSTLLFSGLWLMPLLPLVWLVGLGAAAFVLTGTSVYVAFRNWQRSALMQIIGAAGLSGSAVLAYLAGGLAPDRTLFLSWIMHVVHGTGSVLTVHARIEARRGHGKNAGKHIKAAVTWQVAQAIFAAVLLAFGEVLLAVALAAPLCLHSLDLARLTTPVFRKTPLKKVGFRELGVSMSFSVLVLVALW